MKYLLENAACYWLADLIASYQGKVSGMPFQVWQLYKVDERAKVTMRADGNAELIVKQEIEYTDFPLHYIELWLIDGILLLPSEY